MTNLVPSFAYGSINEIDQTALSRWCVFQQHHCELIWLRLIFGWRYARLCATTRLRYRRTGMQLNPALEHALECTYARHETKLTLNGTYVEMIDDSDVI